MMTGFAFARRRAIAARPSYLVPSLERPGEGIAPTGRQHLRQPLTPRFFILRVTERRSRHGISLVVPIVGEQRQGIFASLVRVSRTSPALPFCRQPVLP